MSERIVVGIDGSNCSLHALHWALAHATATAAGGTPVEVHLVACWQRPLMFDAGGLGVAYPADDDLSSAAKTWLAETVAAAATEIDRARTAGCTITEQTESGSAEVVLERLSQDASLVVVGRRGHNVLERMLGTTSRHVADHARCAVAVVPERFPIAGEQA